MDSKRKLEQANPWRNLVGCCLYLIIHQLVLVDGFSAGGVRCHDFPVHATKVRHHDGKSSKTHLKMCANPTGKEDQDEDEEAGVGFGVSPETASNVLGTTLCPCCENVRSTGIGTGFYRNGYCSTGPDDLGRHTVCVQVTESFLKFSKQVGNDLSTPMPEYMFPGLQEGDIWCLCAQRWVQAYQAGKAPKLFLKSTHENTLNYVPFDILRKYAIDGEEADTDLSDLNEQRKRLGKLME